MSENQMLTRKEIIELFNSTNESLPVERKLNASDLNTVIKRAYAATTGDNISARNFAIRKELNNYIDLATKGIIASSGVNHFDLLPPAHPFFDGLHTLEESELRTRRANWVAADPEVPAELKSVVAAAYMHPEGSIERVHAEIRLMALTTSGKLADTVFKYNTPITAAAGPDDEAYDHDAVYQASRANLLNIVIQQQSLTASGAHPFEVEQNKLVRMIYRGDSRDRIVRELSRNEGYQNSLALLKSDAPTDPYSEYARAEFAAFQDALSNLEDPEFPVDLRAIAASGMKKYDDEKGSIERAILAGASSSYVEGLLKENYQWQGDLAHWESSELVSEPTSEMVSKWNEFAAVYWSLKDLDDEDPRFIPLSEIIP